MFFSLYRVFGDGERIVIPSFFRDVKNSWYEGANPSWQPTEKKNFPRCEEIFHPGIQPISSFFDLPTIEFRNDEISKEFL